MVNNSKKDNIHPLKKQGPIEYYLKRFIADRNLPDLEVIYSKLSISRQFVHPKGNYIRDIISSCPVLRLKLDRKSKSHKLDGI